MIYKNKKTGAVIKTTGKVSGGGWELVKEPSAPKEKGKKPPAQGSEK